ncbi:hypothetical protein RUM8411_03310 [Ruegeria meonggei]|uniref:Uncharacterized protein n=1 Tax=Ruegeria meonggei TaxID=1446476 RepID=A0A1X6ZZH9_9RHOB|nr:hypothetical protein RUM8411_03310 [Ruegeria meonggei]
MGKSVLGDGLRADIGGGTITKLYSSQAYLQGHDLTVRWADLNCRVIADRTAEALRADRDPLKARCALTDAWLTPRPSPVQISAGISAICPHHSVSSVFVLKRQTACAPPR